MPTEIVKNIVSGGEPGKEEKLLDIAPDFDRSLLEDVETGPSIWLILCKGMFTVLVLAMLAAFAFFNFQLTDNFNFVSTKFNIPNIHQQITASNSEIMSAQTNTNMYRYLSIKANLDKFTYFGDSYVQNFEIFKSATTSSSEQEDAKKAVLESRDKMREAFLAAKDLMAIPLAVNVVEAPSKEVSILGPEQRFANELTALLNRKAQEFAKSDDEEMSRENRNYLHTAKLVSNKQIKDLLIATDFDALSDRELYDLVKEVNKIFVNDLTIVNSIKSDRIRWSDIMNEIDLRTKTVDNYYNQNFYDNYGGVRYTSYDFDSKGQKISIIGETKRFDTTNFTMISNLIDELNRSEMFNNAAMRSFSKSGSLEDGYTATLKLGLDLIKDKIIKE